MTSSKSRPKTAGKTAKNAVLNELVKQLYDNVPKYIREKDYDTAARVGAISGAELLAAEMRDGKSNNGATFMPELYIYKGKRNLKLSKVILVQGDETEPARTTIKSTIRTLFKEEKPVAILEVSPGSLTMKPLKKGQRPSTTPHRVSASVGALYLKPRKFKSSSIIAVGTLPELKHAGLNAKNNTITSPYGEGVQFALVA